MALFSRVSFYASDQTAAETLGDKTFRNRKQDSSLFEWMCEKTCTELKLLHLKYSPDALLRLLPLPTI